MKILVDENVDIRFKRLFPAGLHEVYTVRDMQWNGIKNGQCSGYWKNTSLIAG